MVTKQKNYYHSRIQKVVEYIGDNLDNNLSLDKLSEVACFAPYHFHRIYYSIMGETVMKSIRRFRLQRAAKDLIDSDYTLERLARRANYESASSFIRKFSEDFGISPNAYRKRGRLTYLEQIKPKMDKDIMFEVEIKELDKVTVASIDHKGDYMQIGSVFDRLLAYCMEHGLLNEKTRSFGVYYDDPNAVAKDYLRSKACFSVPEDFEDDGEVLRFSIGGKYGVIIHKGSYAELEKAYNWLYGEWLVDSGYEIGDAPPIEEYLNNPKDTPPSELLTAIHIPLK